MSVVKNRLSNIFKEREPNPFVKEQVDILHKLLVSKEDDLKAKEHQFKMMTEIWKEKEGKMMTLLDDKNEELKQLSTALSDSESTLSQKQMELDDMQRQLETEVLTRNRLENRLRIKEQMLSQFDKDRTRIQSFQDEIQEKTNALRTSEDMLSAFRSKIEELEETIGDLNSRVDADRAAALTQTFFEDSQIMHTFDIRGSNEAEQELKDLAKMNDRLLDSMYQLCLLLSSTSMSDAVAELTHDLEPSDASEMTSLGESLMDGAVQVQSAREKLDVFREMLRVKDGVLDRFKKNTSDIQHQLFDSEMSESLLRPTLNLKTSDVGMRSHNTMQTRLTQLEQELDLKEQEITEMKQNVKSAELELEDKENEYYELSERLVLSNKRLRDRQRDLASLKERTTLIEDKIVENESLVLTYSGLYQAKEETLKANEELVVHFEDLVKKTDEQIRIREDQVSRRFQDLRFTNIIENYQ
eukprot:TRINITY_DN8072_c1_g1_i1.p1 TRINITY_DN8072_c1_g1~~TRINITY_DN8072_c1_g1_i1.p1  ORF type:complete len:470 (+),score=127.80 TRINITY_DN8072_c1_g1_i1:154-1563(+)